MISECEQELICDLAETYHIFDYRSLPVKLVATLSSGLRDDSRTKLKLKNEKYAPEIAILAMLVDRLAVIQHGLFNIKQKPVLITDFLYGEPKEDEGHIGPDVFESPEAFEARYKELTKES